MDKDNTLVAISKWTLDNTLVAISKLTDQQNRNSQYLNRADIIGKVK